MIGVERKKHARERHLRKVPLKRRVPFGEANGLGEPGHIEQQVFCPCNAGGSAAIDHVDQVPESARHREIETAEAGLCRRAIVCTKQIALVSRLIPSRIAVR